MSARARLLQSDVTKLRVGEYGLGKEEVLTMKGSRAALGGVIVLYFVIGFEILIMISPFAAFFYAAFNPFLLVLVQHPATRWLTAFFMPHMVLPPGLLLKSVRVAGSVLFVAGAVVFLGCAAQVYYNKFRKKGVALGGLYAIIRHPQYVGLALTGLGLSILWPRFLVLALWVVMLVLYFVLARDEERRMRGQFGDAYGSYAQHTGMFLPQPLEDVLLRLIPTRSAPTRRMVGFALLGILTLGGAFALRSYTVNHLPLWSAGPVTALAILPSDTMILEHRMASVLDMPEIRSRVEKSPGPVLVYVMPKEYIMQGMIADTGGEWKLFKSHHTIAMIGDWIFHPFRHLQGGHAMMHEGMSHVSMNHGDAGGGVVRRLIVLQVDTQDGATSAADLFAINARRTPLFFADVDVHNLIIQDITELPADTGWGRVPTPTF